MAAKKGKNWSQVHARRIQVGVIFDHKFKTKVCKFSGSQEKTRGRQRSSLEPREQTRARVRITITVTELLEQRRLLPR